ncbi:MAG TPA: hypothetical protein VEI02_15735 [Planctomycetota bacterium]|nr:hypothetical protein [Planctomycetota bacterium]
MKATTKKTSRNPVAKPAVAPSEGTSERFKRLVAGGRAKTKAPADETVAPIAETTAIAAETPQPPTETEPPVRDFPGQVTPEEHGRFTRLADVGAAWIEHLKAKGASTSTTASYTQDFALAVQHFGADVDPATITAKQVAAFNESDLCTKKKGGQPRAMPTILKTRRVLRLALAWARGLGVTMVP